MFFFFLSNIRKLGSQICLHEYEGMERLQKIRPSANDFFSN